MNIGIFTDTYFPQINGVATSAMTLAEELRKLGHTVYIFTPNDTGVDKNEKYVYRLPSLPFIFSKNHRMSLIYPPKLLLTFKKLNLDIVHTQTEFSIGLLGRLVSDFYNIPLIHTYHTMYEDYVHYALNGHLISKASAQKFSRKFCNKTDYVISPAVKTKKALLGYGVKKDIKVIPTGLYLDRYLEDINLDELSQLKKSLGIENDKKVCLFLGRIAQEKSIDVLIKAFVDVINKRKDVVLLIVGGGQSLDGLKKLAKSVNLEKHVIFTGFIENSQIHKYYKLGNIFITASTSETQGLTYIEAMASSLPVIAKKDDSINNVITHNYNGYVFEDDSELPNLIIDLLDNTQKQKDFILKSNTIAKEYNANTFATEVIKIYTETLDRHERKKLSKFVKKKRGTVKWKKQSH